MEKQREDTERLKYQGPGRGKIAASAQRKTGPKEGQKGTLPWVQRRKFFALLEIKTTLGEHGVFFITLTQFCIWEILSSLGAGVGERIEKRGFSGVKGDNQVFGLVAFEYTTPCFCMLGIHSFVQHDTFTALP